MSDPENFIARWSRRKREAADEAAKSPAASDAIPLDPLVPARGTPSRLRDGDPVAGTQITSPEQAVRDSRLRGNERETRVDPSAMPGTSEPLVDLTKLPPIDSITAETDIRAFLAPGVPPELARAALRRVWSADPAIRDHIGLSENAWDFNAPGSMAGFGPLELTDELRRQIARLLGGGRSADAADLPAAAPTEGPAARALSATSAGSDGAAAELPPPASQGDQGASTDKSAGTAGPSPNSEVLLQRDKVDTAMQHDAEESDIPSVARRIHGRALPE